ELARALALQADRPRTPPAVAVCTISGTAGVGKTTLAVHWAHQVRDRYPDGQLYLNLPAFDAPRSALNSPQPLPNLLQARAARAGGRRVAALVVPPRGAAAGGAARAARYRRVLAGRRVLLLLDKAGAVDQVRPLLPGTPGCLAIVPSRNQLSGLVATEGAHPLTLDLLSPADAREFLARRLGADRVAAEPEAVEEIADRCS